MRLCDKVAPLLRYGPHTTGGVLNLVSTPIPSQNSVASVVCWRKRRDRLVVSYGGKLGEWGYLFETAQRRSDGFKDIDRQTGYDLSDYLAKLSWEANGTGCC